MADTVKKSRIVSEGEDDLEESLMEEFNMRLKTCLSQDMDKETSSPTEDTEDPLYQNIPIITKPIILNNGHDSLSHNVNQQFIEAEKEVALFENGFNHSNGHGSNGHDDHENIYENLERSHHEYIDMDIGSSDNINDENVYEELRLKEEVSKGEDEPEPEEQSYENVEVIQAPPIPKQRKNPSVTLSTSSVDDPDADGKTAKDRMLLSDDTSCLLFTQTVTSPMLTPSEENIDFLKGFGRDSAPESSPESTSEAILEPQILTTDLDEDLSRSNGDEDVINEPIVRDDAADEVIYENVEVLKSQCKDDQISVKNKQEEDFEEIHDFTSSGNDSFMNSNQGDISNDLEEGHVDSYEFSEENSVIEDYKMVKDKNIEVEEENKEGEIVTRVLDNVLMHDNSSLRDNYVSGGEHLSAGEDVLHLNEDLRPIEFLLDSNLVLEGGDSLKVEERTEETHESLHFESPSEPERIASSEPEKIATPRTKIVDELVKTIATKDGAAIPNREKDTETVPNRIVQNLTSQFLKKEGERDAEFTKKSIEDVPHLKSLDIMKQINKFEVQRDEHDSTQTTTSYVETSTVDCGMGEETKALKKKKTKKSRKEEKENISVTDTSLESFYNVNVKNLCRSFGDLSKIGGKIKNEPKYSADRMRSKSLSDGLLSTNRYIENVFSGVSVHNLKQRFSTKSGVNIRDVDRDRCSLLDTGNLKSSFSKFDALQKKNVLHVRSSDSSKAQEKFNGAQVDTSNCKSCSKAVFQMEQIKAENSIFHKNCFRCKECSKQLTVDTYESHETNLYCKPHFKALFAPKFVENDEPPRSRKPELIIRENQPVELPPDVFRASDKPDLGLEELQSLNMKERFQVFEHYQSEQSSRDEKNAGAVNVKRSPSILSKLAKFQSKGMDVGVADESLNGIPIEESSSEEEEEEIEENGDDSDLIRAKKVQKEKPFHFSAMSDVKSKWEHQGDPSSRDERREERKQEIQSIRNRLFMGKQGKMKEAYQQAVMESESCTSSNKVSEMEIGDTKSIKDRFEKGDVVPSFPKNRDNDEDIEVFESEISKKSRSLFLELDANASKAPQISPVAQPKLEIKKARKASTEDTVKSSEQMDDVSVRTADIQERFKFFETFKRPEHARKQFRITPPRDGQTQTAESEKELYRDPNVVRAEESVEDSVVAKESHTATKMLSKFRQMEESLSKEPQQQGPKPLKRFTPPPEPSRHESTSEDGSGSEEDEDESETEEVDHSTTKALDGDLLEAQKAARAKQLRAKFEKWEVNEIKREQNNSAVNIIEEYGEEQSQVESTKLLRARFESMRQTSNEVHKNPRVKVNRFVELSSNVTEYCEGCQKKVYPLEKITVHGHIYHKGCFKCKECSTILRMDSYTYNQGRLYCTHHFKRLFISKGNYDSAFGLEQHKEKWNAPAIA